PSLLGCFLCWRFQFRGVEDVLVVLAWGCQHQCRGPGRWEGSLMPGSNWNPTLPINGGFVEWPAGPLFLSGGESMVRVEAWVMQGTTGAIQMTYQVNFPPNPTAWLADQVWFPHS